MVERIEATPVVDTTPAAQPQPTVTAAAPANDCGCKDASQPRTLIILDVTHFLWVVFAIWLAVFLIRKILA